ncbi:YfiR family protein [Piscinibacter sp. XHJ-5]|uniref:YfiR family protein n=1 Tax=Piscinibacter sp. XHJ-5 TaxID=3037797 RepID=UPI002452CCD5|nr:YfiR family protein [Piscinibacter sp. XHJ-5]
MEPVKPTVWRATIAVVLAAAGAVVSAAPAEPLEYAVKAAYLVKFPFYVEWPPAAFSSPTAPLNVCVVGDDPFGNLLDEAAAGQQVQGRPLALKRMKTFARDAGCHVVYVGADMKADVLRGSGALIVTDAFPSGSGVIHFVIKDNRVRFTVDDEAASQAGLAISSKLLSVALAVKPRAQK